MSDQRPNTNSTAPGSAHGSKPNFSFSIASKHLKTQHAFSPQLSLQVHYSKALPALPLVPWPGLLALVILWIVHSRCLCSIPYLLVQLNTILGTSPG